MSTKKPLIVNLFGGPGDGKSTNAAFLFFQLKMAGYRCELITEFAKDKTYEKNETALSDQIYVFANQNYRLNQIIKNEKLDVIVTDSPLLIGLIHNHEEHTKEALATLIRAAFDNHDNFNIFLTPIDPDEYQAYGRDESAEEASELSAQLYDLFGDEMDFITTKKALSQTPDILDEIKKRLNN